MDELFAKKNERGKAEFYLATVTSWYPDTQEVRIILDGDDSAMTKKYKTACGAVGPGSRVVVMKMSGTYVVIGPLGSDGTYLTTTISDIFSSITTGFTVSNAAYAQTGKIAMLTAIITPSSGGSTYDWTTWATLKSGKRPCAWILGNCNATTYCQIGPNGEIQLSLQHSANYNYRISATYILA